MGRKVKRKYAPAGSARPGRELVPVRWGSARPRKEENLREMVQSGARSAPGDFWGILHPESKETLGKRSNPAREARRENFGVFDAWTESDGDWTDEERDWTDREGDWTDQEGDWIDQEGD